MTKNTSDITDIRDRIDQIDDRILKLLRERLECALAIGKLKDESKRAKWDPLRERQIYQRLLEHNQDFFPEKALRSIFHEIITTCRLSVGQMYIQHCHTSV